MADKADKGRRRKKKHQHEEKRKSKKHKKHRKRKRGSSSSSSSAGSDSDDVRRSVITGKKIKLPEGVVADAAGQARRAALLAHLNEDEDGSWAPPPAVSAIEAAAQERRRRASEDPEYRAQLLHEGREAARARSQKHAMMLGRRTF